MQKYIYTPVVDVGRQLGEACVRPALRPVLLLIGVRSGGHKLYQDNVRQRKVRHDPKYYMDKAILQYVLLALKMCWDYGTLRRRLRHSP